MKPCGRYIRVHTTGILRWAGEIDNIAVGKEMEDAQHCGGQGDGGCTTLRWAGRWRMHNTAVGREMVGRGDGQHCGGQGRWTTLRWAGEMDNTAVGREMGLDNTTVGRGDGQHCCGQGRWTTLLWAGRWRMDNTAVGREMGNTEVGGGDGQHCGGQGDGQHCGGQGKCRMYKVKERTSLPLPRMSST